MITLLHGNNIVASRAKLIERIDEARGQGKEIRQLDGKKLDALTLIQAVQSSSLFGGSVIVIIEGLLARKTQLNDTLKQVAGVTDIILWEDKEIGKSLITPLGNNTSVQVFKIPVVIFQLLDGLRLDLFHQALLIDAPELIFFMIIRRVRELIMIKDGVIPVGLAEWQTGRLTSQAKSFTMDRLLTMEKRLLEIDISMKTGTSPFPLVQQLELFFIDL